MESALIVIPFPFSPPSTGGEWCAHSFCQYLRPYTKIAMASVPQQVAAFPQPITFPDGKWKYFNRKIPRQIADYYKESPFDWLILHQPFMAPLLLPACKRLGIRMAIYAHNLEYMRFKTMGKPWHVLLKYWERFAFRNAQAVLFISEEEMHAAIGEFGLSPARCAHVPFGTHFEAMPVYSQETAKQQLGYAEKVLLFFGSLSYEPNAQAVAILVSEIMPRLCQKYPNQYKLVVCGGGLPAPLAKKVQQSNLPIEMKGFVRNLEPYLQAAHVMVNPVQTGGGVKTKVMEALAWGKAVVSTEAGAAGINQTVCGGLLNTVGDGQWDAFVEAIAQAPTHSPMPASFYEHYFWGKIMGQAAKALDRIAQQ